MPSTLLLADWTTRLGQELFEPPNVGGWPGGRAWLTARSLVGRANFAAALVEGRPVGLPAPLDAGSIAAEQGLGRSASEVREAASALLLGIASREREAPRPTRRPRLLARLWRRCSPRPRPRSADVYSVASQLQTETEAAVHYRRKHSTMNPTIAP